MSHVLSHSWSKAFSKSLPALLGTALAVMALAAPAPAVNSGQAAPDFSLTGHDGKTYKLSQFKGKHVVLEWFNKDCPYVRKHYNAGKMQQLQKSFGAKGVVWLTVVSSAAGKQGHLTAASAKQQLAQEKASPRVVLLDPTGKVGKAYNAMTTPHMYVINPQGKLVYQGAIDDKPSASPSSLQGATGWFTNALNASIAGKAVSPATTKPYGCSVKY